MRKNNHSIMRILLIILILTPVFYSCNKNPDEPSYCYNCDVKTINMESIKDKVGWIVFKKDFDKYLIEIPYCGKHIFYVLCQLPPYFLPTERDTVVFSGKIIDEPIIPSDTIPETYYCIKIDTIAFQREFPDPGILPQGLKGTWIETTLGMDTIFFTTNDDEGWLWFKNCKYNFKVGLPYPYRISPPYSIFIMDPTSSELWTAMGKNYYFKFDEPKLTINIENFTFRLFTKKSILTFRKIE